MKKQMLAWVLVLAMLLPVLPVGALAADSDFTIVNGVLTKYNGSGGDVTIPEEVSAIGDGAFSGCNNLTRVTIPFSVTSIGNYAFNDCYELSAVFIPDTVTQIGYYAFCGCWSLSSVTIPDSVLTIGDHAFNFCSSLVSVVLPHNISTINHNTFRGCDGLKAITIQNSVSTIDYRAFEDCGSLTDVYYSGCKEEWEEIEIDSSNESIADAVVHFNCAGGYCGDNAVWTYRDNTLTISGSGAIYKYDTCYTEVGFNPSPWLGLYQNQITTVVVEDGITEIGNNALIALHKAQSIELPDTLTRIGSCAFQQCRSLAGIAIPSGIQTLESGTFSECDQLSSIIIPGTVTAIGQGVVGATFVDAVNVYYEGTEADWNRVERDAQWAWDLSKVTMHYNANADFDEHIYWANYLQKSSEISVQIVNSAITDRTPCDILLSELSKTGFNDSAELWRALGLISDTLDDVNSLCDFVLEPKDMYSAIILNALETATSDAQFSELNAGIKMGKDVVSYINDYMKLSYGMDLNNKSDFKNLTTAQIDDIQKKIGDWFEKNHPNSWFVGKELKYLTNGIKTVSGLEELGDYFSGCFAIINTNQYMKEVLRAAYQDSQMYGDMYLQWALLDCIQIIDSSGAELIEKIASGGITIVGKGVIQYAVKEILWSYVTDYVKTACPEVAMLQLGYKAGNTISNVLFRTDDTIEQQLKMIAVTDVENLMNATYDRLKSGFLWERDKDSALYYLNALNFLFELRQNDSSQAYDFVDVLDEALVNKIQKLFGKDSFAGTKEYLDIRRVNYITNQNTAMTAWINQLDVDYPGSGLYELYREKFDKTSQTPIKKILAACPVNVYVYDQSNNIVASVIYGQVSCYVDDVMVAVLDDQKVINLYDGADYRVEYVGYDDGEMDITVTEFNEDGETVRTVNYYDITLTDGKTYSVDVDDVLWKPYQLIDHTDNYAVEHDYDSIESNAVHKVKVISGTLQQSEGLYTETMAVRGETLQINAYVPAGYEFVCWEASNRGNIFADQTQIATTVIMPDEDITITAIMKEIPIIPATSPFVDVQNPAEWYYTPVLWAVAAGVTNGISDTEFAPNQNCTRAQAATFLWRAVGSPEPQSGVNPFEDIIYTEDTKWYYNAVLWAYENGITTGTDATHFDPNGSVTRGQMVTFLWRMHGKPVAMGSTFADVPTDEYYYAAVSWAVANGITNGTDAAANTFEPNTTCTRGHIVTFLYRDLVG